MISTLHGLDGRSCRAQCSPSRPSGSAGYGSGWTNNTEIVDKYAVSAEPCGAGVSKDDLWVIGKEVARFASA